MRVALAEKLILLCLLGGIFQAAPAAAQVDLSAAERQAAAEAAYDRGTRAYRGGDYAQAARWYETANELAPAAAALIQAIRAHDRARNALRAGTLAAHLAAEYGERRLGRHAAVLERAQREGVRVEVRCDGCLLDVGGERESFRVLFLAPDVEHVLVATFDAGRVEERVRGAAGESRELELAPPPPVTPTDPDPDPGDPTRLPEPDLADTGPAGSGRGERRGGGGRDSGGISPAFFVTGLVLTAAAGGLAVWSWLDTLDAAEAFEAMPTQAALDAGRELELRTTLLDIGVGVLGAATLVFLLLTDFGGDDEEETPAAQVSADLLPLPGGAALSARGRF